MSVITAYKCDHDGKIFEDKAKYQAHLRKLARHRRAQRQLKIKEQQAEIAWQRLYDLEIDIKDFPKLVIDNQQMFWAEAARIRSSWGWEDVGKKTRGKIVMPIPRLLEFIKFNVSWTDRVSNTHDCPHNGVTNWHCKNDLPRGYPGWSGHIEYIVAWPKEYDGVYLGSDLFRSMGYRNRGRAYTGTGGGGGMSYNQRHRCHVQTFQYDFRMFAADWPGMARLVEKTKIWQALTG